MTQSVFGASSLVLDYEKEADRICNAIRDGVLGFRKKGITVALSGGIDSSVVAGLCVRALGSERVFGLHMPEKESSKDTLRLSSLVSDTLGIESTVENITPLLEAAGCYLRRNDAIRQSCPSFKDGDRAKIVLPNVTDSDSYRLYSVVVETADGGEARYRLSTQSYLGIVAATNFKQRIRKMLEYYHADRLNYAVSGTPNRLEYDQGFFVKLGDGAADIKPIAHLYKTQVYQMAAFLGLPDEIQARAPTTDTYSMEQSQEEFFFSVPYRTMDLCLLGKNLGLPTDQIAEGTGLDEAQVARVLRDIDQKRKTTRYLHSAPILAFQVPEVGHT